jgi:hypothetical protein
MRFLGKIFLLVLLLIGACVGYGFWKGPVLDKESKAYVDAAVPVIVARWDKQELGKRASPELIESAKHEDVTGFFLQLSRRFGALIHYDGSLGDSRIAFTPKGLLITARYTAKARFARGSAVIQVSLIKHGEDWQFMGFVVDPPVVSQ